MWKRRVAMAAWNGTLDQTGPAEEGVLDRSVRVEVSGLHPGPHHRVDAHHSNIVRTWEGLGRADWADEAGWTRLRSADHLDELEPPRELRTDGSVELAFDLPMPAISLIEFVPTGRTSGWVPSRDRRGLNPL